MPFDTWFCTPSSILAVKGKSLDVVSMAKKISEIHYHFNGKNQPVTETFKYSKKRRGRSRYLLSAETLIQGDNVELPIKIVFVRNRNKHNEYLTIISTDMTLSEDEMICQFIKCLLTNE